MKIANRINSFKDENYRKISTKKKKLEYLFKQTAKLKGLSHVDLVGP